LTDATDAVATSEHRYERKFLKAAEGRFGFSHLHWTGFIQVDFHTPLEADCFWTRDPSPETIPFAAKLSIHLPSFSQHPTWFMATEQGFEAFPSISQINHKAWSGSSSASLSYFLYEVFEHT
jgi:hypothetical protein